MRIICSQAFDWASQTHHVRLSDTKSAKIGERTFAHGGEGLKEIADWILKSTGAAPEAVMVAIEVPHGPVAESLMEWGFPGLRDQPQAARSLPRPFLARRRKG
ncbi:hypothetical protein AMST5_03872 [freshwater sediment metagenome]|uniref:Uncharacterized protein n=1 Tax=freshwater sediment metagenome TaxID=556182 RepID=A0AA48M746_9ZZZZ